jgi:hypothetical protein
MTGAGQENSSGEFSMGTTEIARVAAKVSFGPTALVYVQLGHKLMFLSYMPSSNSLSRN